MNPPFRPGPAMGGDYLSHEGAGRLAAMIRAAWAEVGVDLPVEILVVGKHRREGTAIYGVRMPGLVNGRPHAG